MTGKTNAFKAWLFLGPEIGEKESAIKEIRKNLSSFGDVLSGEEKLSPGERFSSGGLEETVYYTGETTVSTMISHMRNGSLFAEKRLFIVKCAEGIKKKEDIDQLTSFIESPPDDTYLIMISEETSISKGIEKLVSPANKRIFWELSDSRKYEWVENFFRKEGFRIREDGIETILELVENNTAALKQECSRLTLFLERNSEISGEAAEKWLSHTRQESAFTLFSRIASGDLSRSLESMNVLLAAKEALPAIFAGLASCFRKLMNYLALKEEGVTDEAEFRKIGVSSPGAKRDYAAAGRRYNSASAETCLALTAEYDLLTRASGTFPEQILMNKYLYKIHSLGRSS